MRQAPLLGEDWRATSSRETAKVAWCVRLVCVCVHVSVCARHGESEIADAPPFSYYVEDPAGIQTFPPLSVGACFFSLRPLPGYMSALCIPDVRMKPLLLLLLKATAGYICLCKMSMQLIL